MKTLVVAPHPDDELLGCGGTLLRRKAEGGDVGWLIVTRISEESGWSADRVRERDVEIEKVRTLMGFSAVYNLRLPTTRLDTVPMGQLIEKFAAVFRAFEPEEVFMPHRGDVHTDHGVVADAVAACVKWFRFPSVRRVLAYETLSETEFSLSPAPFNPNTFVDISGYLDQKIQAMNLYESEMGAFPFPRSEEAIRCLAGYRGATAGFSAAEAFQLLRERL